MLRTTTQRQLRKGENYTINIAITVIRNSSVYGVIDNRKGTIMMAMTKQADHGWCARCNLKGELILPFTFITPSSYSSDSQWQHTHTHIASSGCYRQLSRSDRHNLHAGTNTMLYGAVRVWAVRPRTIYSSTRAQYSSRLYFTNMRRNHYRQAQIGCGSIVVVENRTGFLG